ncbi:MAG: SDR family oxidoreductase [Saprospiraceae bacterium]|nr:SDR family oxidoreductase [Saprospiraceae bacterium]
MKKAVITGGTKGLGRAIAELFAENGFDLCVCARTESDLEVMKAAWAEKFPNRQLHTFQVDLSKKAEVVEFAGYIKSVWTEVDVLINNAGSYLPGLILEEQDGTLETMLEINLLSAYHLTRSLLPVMLPRKSGYVFNMCSIASFLAYPNASSYSISKFALLGFSRCLREELKPHGIKVTAVMPGVAWSDAWRGATLPYERLMQSSDVAKAIWGCYTLSDAAVVEELIMRPQLGDL